jgi:hypothetical protein
MSTLVANRIAKADRFADFLVEHLGDKATPENVEQFGNEEWLHVANLADEQIPSPATRRLIVNNLRLRQDTSEPFAAFDGMDR